MKLGRPVKKEINKPVNKLNKCIVNNEFSNEEIKYFIKNLIISNKINDNELNIMFKIYNNYFNETIRPSKDPIIVLRIFNELKKIKL